MAHTLVHVSGSVLTPSQIRERLRKEFRLVLVDEKAGQTSIDEAIAYFERLKKRGRPLSFDIDEKLRTLRAVRDEAWSVTISDEESPQHAYLHTILTPEAELFFGYSSREHEDAARPLLERCARVLGRKIVGPGFD